MQEDEIGAGAAPFVIVQPVAGCQGNILGFISSAYLYHGEPPEQ